MTLLVTGGAGFIGSNFIHYLRKHRPEDRVVCLDALTYAGNERNLVPLTDGSLFRFVKGNIGDEALVEAIFSEEKIDAVVNFAAETHVDRSIMSPEIFVKTNVWGTAVLLEACRRHGGVRFHQISTDEVYGMLSLDPNEASFTEDSPLKPTSPYAASKASADLLVLSYQKTFGLPVTVSRCSNNYGPFQHPEKLIPLMLTRAMTGGVLPIYGKGDNVRDWIYVEDHCRAVDLILRKGKIGEIYNVGARCEIKNLDLVRMLVSAVGEGEDRIVFVKDRPGHDLRYAIDPTKLERELGFYPVISPKEGLERTVSWYRENRSFWEPLTTA